MLSLLGLAGSLSACGGGGDGGGGSTQVPQFGVPEAATLSELVNASAGLSQPRDLAWNPLRPEELWVVNYDDDSAVIVRDAPQDSRTTEKRIDGYALHFFEQPTAIAFGQSETTMGIPGTFATCGESRNTYNGQADGNDFTGPTLWSSDMSVFAAQNPNGLGSHLDMLHNTPLCMGIAWEGGNRYWVTGGLSGAIERYDFQTDDGIGNDDHGDGLTWRYAPGTLGYVENVPSHLVVDADAGYVYVADTGHGRILRLDAQTGAAGATVGSFETPIQMVEGAVIDDFVPGGTLTQPSGIELAGGVVFVTDHATSQVHAFDGEGTLLGTVDTGLPAGSLGGLSLGPDDRLYLVDMLGNRVFRLEPGLAE